MTDHTPKNALIEKEHALRAGLILGIVFIIPGASAFIFSNSITILADFLISTVETVAILFSWISIRRITRGKDFEYNYGYGKLEGISSLIVAMTIVLSFIGILFSAWRHTAQPVGISGWGIIISTSLNLFALIMNFRQWHRNRVIYRSSPSPIVDGQLKLFRNKMLSSICVLSTLALSLLLHRYSWAHYIDPIGSLVLSCFLIQSAVGLFHVSMNHLLDKALEEPLQMEIMKVLGAHFDQYKLLHDVQSRRSGSDTFVELFMQFEDETTIREAMDAIDSIKKDLQTRIPGATVNIIMSHESAASE